MYVCETCVVAEAIDDLAPENLRAWSLFQRVCARFVVETRSVGQVLARLLADEDSEDFEDMLTRISILYDVHYPPKRGRKDGA
jgi:hypothetical protein